MNITKQMRQEALAYDKFKTPTFLNQLTYATLLAYTHPTYREYYRRQLKKQGIIDADKTL